MEEREATNNRAGWERRLFCVEAMLRLGEVGGFCLYCRPHKNSKSRSARALVISRQRINMTFKPNGNQSVATGAATLARARSSGRDGRIILGETTVEGPGLLLSLKTEVSCPSPGH